MSAPIKILRAAVKLGEQLFLPFNGKPRGRKGGRKPKYPEGRRPVPHRRRQVFNSPEPVHVVLHFLHELGTMRTRDTFWILEECFRRAKGRNGLRVVQFSIQSDHAHLLVEADSNEALAQGMKGLCVRISKALNGYFHRKGTVFRERYFARVLRSIREVRNALVYVLRNGRKHGEVGDWEIDPFSSYRYFDGWAGELPFSIIPATSPCSPVAEAEHFKVTEGWLRYYDRIGLYEKPAGC